MRVLLILFLVFSTGFAFGKEPLMTQCGESTSSIEVIGLQPQRLESSKFSKSCSSSKRSKKSKKKSKLSP